MNNSFLNQFVPNIKFSYFCFDRVIIRGYIRHLFLAGGVAILLKVLGFRQTTSGIMCILTDQLNAHIEKVAKQKDIPIHWWPSQGGGTDGAKLDFVKKITPTPTQARVITSTALLQPRPLLFQVRHGLIMPAASKLKILEKITINGLPGLDFHWHQSPA